jgi:hypothetical protein
MTQPLPLHSADLEVTDPRPSRLDIIRRLTTMRRAIRLDHMRREIEKTNSDGETKNG